MTREQAKELLPVIQAWSEGKTIQCSTDGEHWDDVLPEDTLAFCDDPSNYRIKPQPREFWLHVCINGGFDVYAEHKHWMNDYNEPQRLIHVIEVCK